ncbi:MAG: tetratricopeptide repeat protein [Nitrospirae bacterium]|nr:MAG: tetratricopeptide repeat protein [Nitrospirota bacterium]
MASDKDAKIEKARQLAESGKFVSAIKAWRELLDETPHNDANVYNTIGDLCLKNKGIPDAIDAYSKAARFYLQEGFHLKAVALYKKILKLDPNRAEIYTLLGDLNVVRGLMNNAVADYLSGAKLYLKIGKAMNALTLFRKITKVDPQNTDMRLRVAELCLKEKLTDEAIEEYLRIGREYQRLGRTDEAGKLYEQILKIAPGHAEARRRLDNPLEPVAETPEPAISAVEEITVADTMQSAVALEAPAAPEPAPAVDDLAELAASLESSMPVFEAATAPAPEQPTAVPTSDAEGAIEFNTEGLAFEPHDRPAAPQAPPPVEAEAPVLEVEVAPSVEPVAPVAAVSSQATGTEFEAIFEEFRKGIKEQIGDEEFETHYDLGVAYKEMGLITEAIEEFQLAARGPTRFVDACTMIAACYRDQDLSKSAITFLERVLADARCAGPGVPYVQYDLAVLYEEEGFSDKAIRLYEKILPIRDVEARLRRLQGGEEPMVRPPAGAKRPISYL